jgi:hypothetical protein
MAVAATVLLLLHRPSNKWKAKKNLLLPLPHASRGRRRPTVPSKRHRFGLLFFFLNQQCMKRRRVGQNAPFHLNENGAKLMSKYKSVLNL